MGSIVNWLKSWADRNSAMLKAEGVHFVEKFPQNVSAASLEFTYNDIIITYTVWELTEWISELIVFNGSTLKTILIKEGRPKDIPVIEGELDTIVRKLLDGVYSVMLPDPNLIIS